MVATNDEMRATEVLTEHRVQQRLTRTRVTHLDRIACLHDRSRHEIVTHERIDGGNAHVGWDVARLERAEHLMNQHTVADLDRDLCQMLVAAMHGIAGLKRRDP